MKNTWIVHSTKAERQAKNLNQKILLILRLLFEDLAHKGPALPSWPHYGKLKNKNGDKRHCHLQRGKPTYICCWEVVDKKQRVIEVYYVGTHEKAPY